MKKRLFHKKAQAALEFLMTYGWAILVVLIVIGALAYFGVLNPTILLPEKCTLQMGMYCKNHILLGEDNEIYLELENGMGKGVILRQINVTSNDGNVDCYLDFTNGSTATTPPSYPNDYFNDKHGFHINNGQARIINITPDKSGSGYDNCTVKKRVGKTKMDLQIKWHFDDANALFTHTMNGEILAIIE